MRVRARSMRTGVTRVGNRCYIQAGTQISPSCASRAGYVARIQRPACIEKRAIAIQNRCRWLRGVESLELPAEEVKREGKIVATKCLISVSDAPVSVL